MHLSYITRALKKLNVVKNKYTHYIFCNNFYQISFINSVINLI